MQEQQPISMEPEMEFPEGYSINEFGEIIRPARDEQVSQYTPQQEMPTQDNKLTIRQRVAQFFTTK